MEGIAYLLLEVVSVVVMFTGRIKKIPQLTVLGGIGLTIFMIMGLDNSGWINIDGVKEPLITPIGLACMIFTVVLGVTLVIAARRRIIWLLIVVGVVSFMAAVIALVVLTETSNDSSQQQLPKPGPTPILARLDATDKFGQAAGGRLT